MIRRLFGITLLLATALILLPGCDLVFTSSVADQSDNFEVTYDESLEGEWEFDREASDRQWRNHSWRVEQQSDTQYKLTQYVGGTEVPHSFRGRLIRTETDRLFELQALTWPPGTVPGFNLYRVNELSEDRVELASLDREAALDVLTRDEFNDLDYYRRENYPLLIHSSGPIIDRLIEVFLNEELFTIKLVFRRVPN